MILAAETITIENILWAMVLVPLILIALMVIVLKADSRK